MLRNQAIGGGGAVCDLNRTAVAPLSASRVVYSSSSSPPYVKGGEGGVDWPVSGKRMAY